MAVKKPDTRTAMYQLIEQIKSALPFDMPESQMCSGPCEGCSMKLLAYLDGELDEWQRRLEEGDKPSFSDLSRLASSSKKIHAVLKRNGQLAD